MTREPTKSWAKRKLSLVAHTTHCEVPERPLRTHHHPHRPCLKKAMASAGLADLPWRHLSSPFKTHQRITLFFGGDPESASLRTSEKRITDKIWYSKTQIMTMIIKYRLNRNNLIGFLNYLEATKVRNGLQQRLRTAVLSAGPRVGSFGLHAVNIFLNLSLI